MEIMGIIVAVILFFVKIAVRESIKDHMRERKNSKIFTAKYKRSAIDIAKTKYKKSGTTSPVSETKPKEYTNLSIAWQTYRFLWEVSEKITYDSWLKCIDSKKELITWIENPEQVNELLTQLHNIPEMSKNGILNTHASRNACVAIKSENTGAPLHIFFDGEHGIIYVSHSRNPDKATLLLLLDMAENINALLLESGRKAVKRGDVDTIPEENAASSVEHNRVMAEDMKTNSTAAITSAPLSKDRVMKDLHKLSFFEYAADVEKAVEETFDNYADDGRICFPYKGLNRIFSLDAKSLFEASGLKDQIQGMLHVFNAMGIKIEVEDYKENFGSVRYVQREIIINGRLYDACPATDWSDSAASCIRVINEILKNNNKNEKVYLLYADESSELILLTDEQFAYLHALIPQDSEYKPTRV